MQILQLAKSLAIVGRAAARPILQRGAGANASIAQNLLEKREKEGALNPVDRLKLAVASANWALANPYQGQGVAVLAEITGEDALRSLRDRMLETEEGSRILHNRIPALVDIGGRFGDGTLGKLLEQCVPEERSKVVLLSDPQLAFIMRRYRDAHDILHALTGFPVTVTGEIALKWFELASTGMPMTALSAVFGLARIEPQSASLLLEWIPWASTAGRKGNFYLGIDYGKYLDYDVDEFREKVLKWPQMPSNLKNHQLMLEHYKAAIDQAHREGREAIALREEAKKYKGFEKYVT